MTASLYKSPELSSELSELGDDVYANSLVQAAEAAQALAIRTPVEADHGLRGDNSGVEELHRAGHANRNVVLPTDFGRFFFPGTSGGSGGKAQQAKLEIPRPTEYWDRWDVQTLTYL